MATLAPHPDAPAHLDNPLDNLLGYHLRRASAAVLADLGRSLDDMGLKPTEASVLLLIGANPGVTQSEIGRVLGIKRANMAPIAAILTDRHLIERTRPDGRSQGLQTGEKGRQTVAELRRRIDAHEARLLPHLTPQKRAALTALVKSVWSILLESGLVDQSQKMTVAASAMAEKKTVGHRS